MIGPRNTPKPAVTIVYDCRGERKSKTFSCHYAARRFYVKKLSLNKNPKVHK